MTKTMKILKSVVLALVLVPLISASSVKELEIENQELKVELAQLKNIVHALQAQMKTKVDTVDFVVKLNDTSDLEARVTVLEASMEEVEGDVVILQNGFVTLTDEVDDVESANLLQDDRLNIIETDVSDNENDIEELVDITTGLTTQVSTLEQDVTSLDQRVGDLEAGGGGSGNVTDLEIRVETLEGVTSQLTDDVASLEDNDVTQGERISSIEEDMTLLDQRVEDLESGNGGGGNGTEFAVSIFMAVLTSEVLSSSNPLVFDNDVINPGDHYSTETGQYTVPFDGIYQFFINLQANSSTDTVYFYLHVDGSAAGSHGDQYQGDLYRSVTVLLELTAGQTVHVAVYRGAAGDTTYFRSYFGGYLIKPN